MAQDPNTAAKVVLWSNVRAMQTFMLLHEFVCTELDCRCSSQVIGVRHHDPVSGVRDIRAQRRRMCQTVTIMAKGTPGHRSDPLPSSVLRIPDIIAARARGDIRVEAYEDAPPPPPAEDPTPPEVPTDTTEDDDSTSEEPADPTANEDQPHPPNED